jgi:hypothetical protein
MKHRLRAIAFKNSFVTLGAYLARLARYAICEMVEKKIEMSETAPDYWPSTPGQKSMCQLSDANKEDNKKRDRPTAARIVGGEKKEIRS